jgi:hypothetical protein
VSAITPLAPAENFDSARLHQAHDQKNHKRHADHVTHATVTLRRAMNDWERQRRSIGIPYGASEKLPVLSVER